MAGDSERLAQLVVRLQNGDMAAFDEIYKLTNEKAVFTSLKICKNKEDANDIVQESYMYLLEKVNDIKNPEAFTSWFNMVVASKTKNMLRKKNPVLFNDNETEELVLDSIEDTDKDFHPPSDFEQTELRTEVMSLIDGLSDDKRAAVILFYYEEMTTKQIAESLGVNENTIKSRLVQAKKDLAKGVKELEKKNKSLYGIAPIPLIIWALKDSAKVTGKAFATSGKAAATLATVKATYTGAAVASGAAAAGTTASVAGASTAGGFAAKIAGLSVAQKIISGVVVAGIVTGGAVGTKKIVDNRKEEVTTEPTASVQVIAPTNEITENNMSEPITTELVSKGTTLNVNEAQTVTTVNIPSVQTSVVTTKNSATTKRTTTKRSTTTKRTVTTKKTTTVGKATVTVYVYDEAHQSKTDYASKKTITIDAGTAFSRADAIRLANLSADEVSVRSGASVSSAKAGESYVFEIDT